MSAAIATPSPWRAGIAAPGLCAWRNRELAALGQVVAGALNEWIEAWALTALPSQEVRCTPAAEAAADLGGAWASVGGEPGASAWLQWDAGQAVRVAQAWFGDKAAPGPVTTAMVDACRADLLRTLAGALRLRGTGRDGAPDRSTQQHWTGGVVAPLPAHGLLLLQGGAVQPLVRSSARPEAASRERLVAVREALRPATVQLQVELDGCDVGVGDLQSLQPGDVLTLRHRADAPAKVVQPDAGLLFSGWLAGARGRKALELGPAVTGA